VRLGTPERIEFLGDVAETITRRLTTGTLPPPPELAKILSPVVRSGDLLLHSTRPAEQSLFHRLGADGELREGGPGEDVLAVVDQNAAGNKLDAYLHRSITYDVASPASTARLRVDLRNDGPTTGVPDIVNASVVGDPRGTNRTYLSIHTSRALVSATLDGTRVALESETEAGLSVYSAFVVIPPESTTSLEVVLGPLSATGGRYRLRVHHQPTVIADELTLRLPEATVHRRLTESLDQ
jgi:hypothetical protein